MRFGPRSGSSDLCERLRILALHPGRLRAARRRRWRARRWRRDVLERPLAASAAVRAVAHRAGIVVVALDLPLLAALALAVVELGERDDPPRGDRLDGQAQGILARPRCVAPVQRVLHADVNVLDLGWIGFRFWAQALTAVRTATA